MKIEKLKSITKKELINKFVSNVSRGLIMTMLLAGGLYTFPKPINVYFFFAIFINIVLIAYVVYTFKSDLFFKDVWDMYEKELKEQKENQR